ncbi:glycoside hydrolase family 12 protein, partial [Saccharata proteae CBS 121410]
TFCGQYDAANSTSLRYTLLADEWGDDGSGEQCMTADDSSTSFNATWSWSGNRTEVHSFPSVILNSELFPLSISNLSSLTLNASWSIYPGDSFTAETDGANLATIDTVADVALDMFLDDDGDQAGNASIASTEIMIWQAAYGNLQPLGWDTVSDDPPVVELAGVNYTLFQGNNANGQAVFSWVPETNLSSIDTDLYPLMSYLLDGGYIPDSIYLGRMQFGSETMHSSQNMTFMVDYLEMNI